MLARISSASLLCVLLVLPGFAQAPEQETGLYQFNSRGGGAENPTGGLLMDQSGNLYGATLSGTVFEFSPNGSGGWTYKSLCACGTSYSFGSLVMDQSGNLYGSTYFGDVYEYSPGTSGTWAATLVHSFGVSDQGPSPLVLDAVGNLYGIFASGGGNGLGYVFELSPATGGTWVLADLHDFNGSDGAGSTSSDAGGLIGGLIMDASGKLYGTTGAGGSSTQCASGCGVVFELTNSGGTWTETVLHSFSGTDGMNPDAPLLMDSSGHLYGTTAAGGSGGFGVVFETAFVSGTWQTHVIHNFTNVSGDGAFPNSALIMDTAGNLYGTTDAGGGSTNCTVVADNGCGTAFELLRKGETWHELSLHRFLGKGDGGFPGGLVFGVDGNLYGVATVGGRYNDGLVFELSP
jgi:uncharacterized repeat protein (TIGR03803 family)